MNTPLAPTSNRTAAAAVRAPSRLQMLVRRDAAREGLERFIAGRFGHTYATRIEHFADRLIGLADAEGQWTAGIGYTPASEAPLFIEQYLDVPVEQAIAERLGVKIRRSQVVEVGNLAATVPGYARRLVILMTELLHRIGYSWVVFTSTQALLNTFARLDVSPIVLAPADPNRLVGGAECWGSYYDTRPHVMAGRIPIGFIRFRASMNDAARG